MDNTHGSVTMSSSTYLEDNSNYQYDLAVIYTAELLPWLKSFISLAEKHWSLRVFLFDRDNMPGGAIVEEWANNLQRSRRILLFATSSLDEWAEYATILAHSFSPSGKSVRLGIAKLEECKQIDCFKVFTVIDYTRMSGRDFFWQNVYAFCTDKRVTLVEDIPGFQHLKDEIVLDYDD